ncbi:MAG TPA: cbb3-type cytochrome c oxidase N-terminal domain-containing protein [Verrucomicrobiota bacterium]|jgi:cytochrome c oxidase cbb3-type subunit 3|nr:cbb3-type cytochrome c oxidase N-terminal domain-containing protein [Verrucomicrobiota bacterium]HRT08113.1 cbb3-type cytochrome c oxidase N-terminal domain-containing protein [Candidatus Paceibacterota bacterium]HRT58306.1 cbb3-type cytochrome c oxidase N-terminal domain-containing protein [Candidatus Paceibacterota bacterium]
MNPTPQDQDPLLLDHDYDGIRELDNKLPRWWVWLFNLSIVFAILYLIYYHVLDAGPLMAAQYQAEMAIGEKIKAAAVAEFENRMVSLQPSTDPLMLAEGRETFEKLCAPCHRSDGGGLVGPNLTDDYWIHGSNFVDNLKIIWNGVPSKGMVTWKGVLKPGTIHAVGSYIYTLRGTHPKNPKPREDQAPVQTGPSEFE